MKIRMQSPLFVIGKPTQQGKKDQTVTYYFATVSQGEEDAGRIRVASPEVYNRIEKYKEQLFTFEYNDQYNSFSIVDVAPISDNRDTGTVANVEASATPNTDKPTDAPTPDTGKQSAGDKKH